MWPRLQISAKNISQNKNANKRRQRTALRFDQFASTEHISDNIYRLDFKVNDQQVTFLCDLYHPDWIVSECDDFIIGSGVIKKCF